MSRGIALALQWGAACLALAMPNAVRAGGGVHIVDDDPTVPAGVCHVETWTTLPSDGGGLVVAAPACTLAALLRIEIAAALQSVWGNDAVTTVAPALKLNLRSFEEAPVGVAVSGTAVWNTADGRIGAFPFNIPVLRRVNGRLIVHANLGWIGHPGTGDCHALFWGAQAEFAIVPDLVLMGEVFGTDRGAPGGQTGLRWVTDRGRIDIDLLAAHRIDGGSASSVTLGSRSGAEGCRLRRS